MGYVVSPSSGVDAPEVPDALYRATITAIKPITLDQPDAFGKSEKIELDVTFEVDGEEVRLNPRVNPSWGELATLFKIAQAAGLDPSPHEPFDTDLLLKKQVNILTEQEEGRWPRIKAWSRVTKGKAQKPVEQEYIPAGVTDISAWWAETRNRGWERKAVLELSHEMYGCEPAELAYEDRVVLLEAIEAK